LRHSFMGSGFSLGKKSDMHRCECWRRWGLKRGRNGWQGA
jgi:hypothetical protein